MNACTIIAWNYLAHARVLARSFRAHHPGGTFSVLLLDDPASEFSARGEDFSLVRPQEIMEPAEFHRQSLIYDVTELATAVKPWLLRHLLREGQSEVVFFDPDVEIFAPLDDISELARRHSIVLTPHDVIPAARVAGNPSEIQVLQSGAYNLGFIALGRDTAPFLTWWAERLSRNCLAAPEQGMFVDQRWVDLVPGYFDHYILKDPGCNVAYWNLSNRSVAWNGVEYRVNGEPLRFFHFSGFSPEKPHLLSKHALPSPRVLLSEHPAVKRLCRSYAKELLEQGHESLSPRPYGLGALSNGLPIDRRMRSIYRSALLRFERGIGDEPPAPNGDSDGLLAFFNEPAVRSGWGSVSRYLHAIYAERPDLQAEFPDLGGADGQRYLRWVRDHGAEEARIPAALLPNLGADSPSLQPARRTGSLRPGVNVAGYFRAELGVGEAARQLVSALEEVGVPYATVTLEETVSRQDHPFPDQDGETPYDFNIVCVNADMLPGCAKKLGPEFFEGRYTIGVWHWEVSPFPRQWLGSFAHVDEIWVASEYTASCVGPVSPKPVRVIPPPVTLPSLPESTRVDLGLPERFLFLFLYDFMSVLPRKNPLALIDAFRRAFAPGEGPVLVLKSINGDRNIEAFEQVKVSAQDHADVLVIDRYFSRETTLELLASCDCYVSLHRAEGFGLTMAEAMVLGKPVIATGFSGNLTYMTDENAYLARYRMVPIGTGCDPYPASGEWAEPDIDDAARLMRRVYECREEAREKGLLARKDLVERHSPSVRAELIGRRLAEIREERARSPVAPEAVEPAAPEPETQADESPSVPAVVEAAPPEAAAPPQPVEKKPEVPSAHDRVYSRSMEFPPSAWQTTRRFRPALPAARSALVRLLRPYTESLRAVHAAILEDVQELGRRIDDLERDRVPSLRNEIAERHASVLLEVRELAKRIASLEHETLPALASEVGEGRRRAEESLKRLAEREGARAEVLSRRLESLEAEVARGLGRDADVERHLAKLVTDVSAFQEAAKGHLASLTGSVQASEQTLDRLSRQLHALPYTSEPLRLKAEDGRECIGYDSGGDEGAGGEVFEDLFHGSREFVKERLRVYLALVRDREPVVDIGCGRGEFLDLLAQSGIEAEGVDADPRMVEHARKNGHRVVLSDAARYLEKQPDASLGCIFSAHFIEHLPFESLLSVLRLSRSKLTRGGLFIAETVNPHSIAAMKNFWIDLTHQKPIFPEVAVSLCRSAAFRSARIFFPRGTGVLAEDLWTQGEYAVVATV
jgi:glycosyltransferase involved in cell wall biosynthesis/2-polyprenyl-3-methyl-5-hydroxy-6-metoxy-1,4-benzoquinol methylase